MDKELEKIVTGNTKNFQNYLINNDVKLKGGADGIFGAETLTVAIKFTERLKQER